MEIRRSDVDHSRLDRHSVGRVNRGNGPAAGQYLRQCAGGLHRQMNDYENAGANVGHELRD